jgi:outer membrane protein TolC
MQTQTDVRQSAEDEIFALRRKIEQYAAVGDSEEVSRLQLEISRLQQKHGAVTGTRRKNDERTA